MTASEWIESQRAQMQEKDGNRFWGDPELESALADAAAAVQQDIPIFTDRAEFTTQPGVSAYEISENMMDGLSLKIGGERYEKVSASMLFTSDDEQKKMYMIEGKSIVVLPEPTEAREAVFEYWSVRPQAAGEATLVLPRPYHEAMRRYFLFRVYEKQPDRKSRELATYYLRLYEQEISKRKRSLSPTNAPVRSGYRKV
ncbi:phage adaptor protein [Hydrogenimonas sp.]